MLILKTRSYKPAVQFLTGILLVILVSGACFFATDLIGYRVVALLLLVTVSAIAMLFDMLPVITAAVLSALIWNFFFIPPVFTFHIGHAEDLLMFLMYFVIALLNAILTYQLRKTEKKVRDREEKEHSIRMYNTLLNSLSHELRTPIATIIGAVDTLQDSGARLSPESRDELLKQIDTAGTRLNREVENLLNMSRLESGTLKVKRDWCDVHELIHGVIQKLQPVHHRELLFETPENMPLYRIDEGLTEQLIYNIVHNAVQHTPEGTRIIIRVLPDPDHCIIEITDNGNGFPHDQIPLVFEKFHRLPDTAAGGTGLGLSIARGFAEAHNGSIRLQNNPEGGACFTITLPAETSFLNNLKNE